MKHHLLLALMGICTVEAGAQSFYSAKQPQSKETGIIAGTGLSQTYNYNVFYTEESQLNDMSSQVLPTLGYAKQGSNLGVRAIAEGRYEKFQTYSKQDHFDYRASLEVPLFFENGNQIKASGDYESFSDRAATIDGKRYYRNKTNAAIEGKFPLSPAKRFGAQVSATLDTFLEIEQERFTHLTLEGVSYYEQNFLPETHWFVRGTGGMTNYPVPSANSDIFDYIVKKYNSVYGMGEAGINGRLTERASIDAAIGYILRYYDDPDLTHFTEPVFYIRFTEQVTRRDQLIGGFNYVVKEAYWSNYFADQEIFLGFGRVQGDQLLLLTRLAYNYRTYSPPNRRDDQRLTASFAARYSVTPHFKVTGDLQADVLNTDPYNNNVTDPSPDRAASYRAGKLSLGILAEF